LESQQKLLSRWFTNRIKFEAETFCKLTNAGIGPEEYLKQNLLFVTMTCRPASGQRSGQHTIGRGPAAVRRAFQSWYCKVCRSIIGNSWQRQMPQQPLTLFVLDADGSRNFRVSWSTATNIHVHGLMLFHPNAPAPSDLAELEQLGSRVSNVDAVQLRRFDPDKCSLYKLTTYCTKSVRSISQDHDLFDFLPPNMKGRWAAVCRSLAQVQSKNAYAAIGHN
jgi:hypothetical protein